MATDSPLIRRYMIQSAGGGGLYVVAEDGRCGSLTKPMPIEQARGLAAYLNAGGSADFVRSFGWPDDWRARGYNGILEQAQRALRYLADNDRPIGGEQFPNSASCYQLADELAVTQRVFAEAMSRVSA